MSTNISPEELFQKRLSRKLFEQREKLRLLQSDVADLIGKSVTTYQRWESTGKCLTNIYDLLKVFEVLKFSTPEIIGLLGLPLPSPDELKGLYPDWTIREKIKKDSICPYVNKNCTDMNNDTIEELLDVLFAERLKRRRHKNQ